MFDSMKWIQEIFSLNDEQDTAKKIVYNWRKCIFRHMSLVFVVANLLDYEIKSVRTPVSIRHAFSN